MVDKKNNEEIDKLSIIFMIIALSGSIFFYKIGKVLISSKSILIGGTIFSFFIFYGFLINQNNKRKAYENLAKLKNK